MVSLATSNKQLKVSLKRLRVERIDLWQLHRVDPNFPIEETLRPVADAVAAGKIKYVGLSEVDVDQIELCRKSCAHCFCAKSL